MTSIIKVDQIQKANGAAGVHIAGHVIQVVSSENESQVAMSNVSSYDFSALDCLITVSAGSKVLVSASIPGYVTAGGSYGWMKFELYRDTTKISNGTVIVGWDGNTGWFKGVGTASVLDTPPGAGTYTYKVKIINAYHGTTLTNCSISETNTASCMNVMEIAG